MAGLELGTKKVKYSNRNHTLGLADLPQPNVRTDQAAYRVTGHRVGFLESIE